MAGDSTPPGKYGPGDFVEEVRVMRVYLPGDSGSEGRYALMRCACRCAHRMQPNEVSRTSPGARAGIP